MRESSRSYHTHVELSDWNGAPERPDLHRLVRRLQPGAAVTLFLYTGSQIRGTVSATTVPEERSIPKGESNLSVTASECTYVVASDRRTDRYIPRVWWHTPEGTTRGTFLTGLRVRSPAPAENQLSAAQSASDILTDLDETGR